MNKLHLLLCFLLVSLLNSSCKDKNTYIELVKEWSGKSIYFPDKVVFTQFAKDTLPTVCYNTEYIIISYVDSVGCLDCRLQLGKWKKIIKEFNEKSNSKLFFMFIMHPKDVDELHYVLRKDNFKYPVYVDINDSFNKLNHFPSDMMFQTFLVGKDRKVLAMGNPVHNPRIKALYLDIISGKEISAKKQEVTTKVEIVSMQVDFGSFDWEDVQTSTFSLQNIGNNPLIVQDIITSCGCTTVEYSKEPVPAGKSLDIKVIYKAERPEHFNKTITVYCNTIVSPLQLKIQGNAK